MFMTVEGLAGTGVDADEAAAVEVLNWYWGLHDEGAHCVIDADEGYTLTVVRKMDGASAFLRRLFFQSTKTASVSFYDYAANAPKRVKTGVVRLVDVQVASYRTVSWEGGCSAEILGLRFVAAVIGLGEGPVERRGSA